MAVQWAMTNSGQICMSVERVYVEEPIYDEFVSKVVDKTKALRQGKPGAAGDIDVGAMTFPPQLEKVEAHVKDALEKGARVLTGGKRAEGPGRFYEPTVIVDVDHTMDCMTDETFGPTLPIMKVRDEDEAVRMANDSRLRAQLERVHARYREGRARGAAGGGRQHLRERCADELPRAGGTVRGHEGLRDGRAPQRGGHPQVHAAADDPDHPLRAEQGADHVSQHRQEGHA